MREHSRENLGREDAAEGRIEGRNAVLEALRAGILGGAVFLVCEVLLHSILDRLSSGAVGKYRKSMAVLSALLLWLAAQILMSIGL